MTDGLRGHKRLRSNPGQGDPGKVLIDVASIWPLGASRNEVPVPPGASVCASTALGEGHGFLVLEWRWGLHIVILTCCPGFVEKLTRQYESFLKN
jgi:hypothetical protein